MKDLQTLFTEYETSYSESNLRAKGREDGQKGVPSASTKELSPYENEIVNSARLLASSVRSHFRSKLETIDADIKGSAEKAARMLQDAQVKINANYDSNRKLHDESHDLRTARDRYEIAKKRFDVMFSKLGRMPIRYIPHWLYAIFAFVIFIGEIPLNAMVFQIFGENQIMTWVMAFVIGLSIPLSAHFIGIKAREHEGRVNWANVTKALIVSAMMVIALRGLSIMRHDYLLSVKEALGLDDRIIETSYLFFWLNIAVFGAATILAYLAHDPAPGYEQLHKDRLSSQKSLSKEEEQRSSRVKWVENARANELEGAREQHREAIERVFKLKGEYDQVLIQGIEQELRCQHQMMRDLSIYRHENIRNRKDPESPACFSLEVENEQFLQSVREKLNSQAESTDA